MGPDQRFNTAEWETELLNEKLVHTEVCHLETIVLATTFIDTIYKANRSEEHQ